MEGDVQSQFVPSPEKSAEETAEKPKEEDRAARAEEEVKIVEEEFP